jgi:hypothetical protein
LHSKVTSKMATPHRVFAAIDLKFWMLAKIQFIEPRSKIKTHGKLSTVFDIFSLSTQKEKIDEYILRVCVLAEWHFWKWNKNLRRVVSNGFLTQWVTWPGGPPNQVTRDGKSNKINLEIVQLDATRSKCSGFLILSLFFHSSLIFSPPHSLIKQLTKASNKANILPERKAHNETEHQ